MLLTTPGRYIRTNNEMTRREMDAAAGGTSRATKPGYLSNLHAGSVDLQGIAETVLDFALVF